MLLPLVNRSTGGGISPTPEEKVYLYKNGVWNVGYDNPGEYTNSWGADDTGFEILSDKLRNLPMDGYAKLIGTTQKVDVSNYDTLHFVAKSITNISGRGAEGFVNNDSKIYDPNLANVKFTTIGEKVDYALDISTRTLCYIGIFGPSLAECEVYEIYLVPKQPKYIIKDGEYISGSMSWDYNIAGNTGTSNPVSIVNKDGYIEIKKNFGYTWNECRASAYVENIGISIANGDMIHMRAKISTTANFGSGGNFRIASTNSKSTSRTYYGTASLNAAETITDFAYKNTLNNPPIIVLPEFNKPTTASGISGTITIEVYDLYVI